MLDISGCLGNEKETSVEEIGEMYDSASACDEWEKKEGKVWACQKVNKKYMCLQKKRKEKS